MEFEILKKSHLKRNIIIGVVAVTIISAIILNFTRAKYRVTESIPLVNGTINYSLADFNSVAIYIQGDDGYSQIDTIPESGYALNEEESYCKVDDTRDDNISLSYDIDTKTLNVTPMTTKGTKCYLYFDELILVKDTLLANYPTVLTRANFLTTVTNTTTGIIYKSNDSSQHDNDGEVYYFAGNPTDNWVKFAGFYWRIIRINGDGTIRMIYQGTSANTRGSGTYIEENKFNSSCSRSEYVGLKYTLNEQHGNASNSDLLNVLELWYNNNINNYNNYVSESSSFCSDRNTAIGHTWNSQTSATFYYASFDRLINNFNATPTFKCNENDIIVGPIGLITADEALFAGLLWYQYSNNTQNFLYTGTWYWTMTPVYFTGGCAYNFAIDDIGDIYYNNLTATHGIRPVINLKASVTISSGSGTSSNPYVIE